MKAYERHRRIRRLEVARRGRPQRQPNPKYHDPRLDGLTVGELEALKVLFDREGEAVTWQACEVALAEYRSVHA